MLTRIALAGAGRMGEAIARQIAADPALELSAVWARDAAAAASRFPGAGSVSADLAPLFAAADCVIDFSLPAGSVQVADRAAAEGTPLVCGVSGLDPDQFSALEGAAERIPVVFDRNMLCVDLGSAPGSWSQYVSETLKGRARLVAVDLLQMDTLPDVTFIQADFREEATVEAIIEALGGERADLVMSDMAPNLSGNRAVDQPRSMYLVELALDLCRDVLKPGGDFVAKLFQGEGSDALIAATRKQFGKVRVMGLFLGLLVVGFIYEWKKGALEWD